MKKTLSPTQNMYYFRFLYNWPILPEITRG